MEVFREMAPFAVGLLLPPVLFLAALRRAQSAMRFWGAYVASLLVGAAIAFIMGELRGDIPEMIAKIVIDSSLVFAGSQVAYRLFWRQVLTGSARQAASEKAIR